MCIRDRVPPEWLSKVYVSERFLEEPEAEQLLAGKTYEVVADAVFKSISDTQTPQGILCLVRMPQYPLSGLLRGDRTHLLIVESIQDPGNLGTMLRTGEGAGITGIIMNRTTVDLFKDVYKRQAETLAKPMAESLAASKVAQSILSLAAELGTIPAEEQQRIAGEQDDETLEKWLKLAARSTTVEEFLSGM